MYDPSKDRRYGALFLSCLLGGLGLLILAAIFLKAVMDSELQGYVLPALPLVGLLSVVWAFLAFRSARQRQRERDKYPPLSRDELRVARSKLLKDRKEQS